MKPSSYLFLPHQSIIPFPNGAPPPEKPPESPLHAGAHLPPCLSLVNAPRKMGYRQSLFGQGGWILAKFFFFACVRTETESRSIRVRQRARPISSHLDQTSFVNKGFIICTLMNQPRLRGQFFLAGHSA